MVIRSQNLFPKLSAYTQHIQALSQTPFHLTSSVLVVVVLLLLWVHLLMSTILKFCQYRLFIFFFPCPSSHIPYHSYTEASKLVLYCFNYTYCQINLEICAPTELSVALPYLPYKASYPTCHP